MTYRLISSGQSRQYQRFISNSPHIWCFWIKVCKQMTQMFHLFPSSYYMNDLFGFNITIFDYFTILHANLKYKALLKRNMEVHNSILNLVVH